jgi:predicted RNA-binding Zn-ribbon protein involved in translation (DUF1610 family)
MSKPILDISCPSCGTMLSVPMELEQGDDSMSDFFKAMLWIEDKYGFHSVAHACPTCGNHIVVTLTVTSHSKAPE